MNEKPHLSLVTCLFTVCATLGLATPARADDDGLMKPETGFTLHVGAGQNYMPQWAAEWFVERAPGSGQNTSLRIGLERRVYDIGTALNLQCEGLDMPDGIWIERGERIPQDGVDEVVFHDLRWCSADIAFSLYSDLSENLWLRYTAGVGAGLFLGRVTQEDHRCTTSDVASCEPMGTGIDETDLPPVFPVAELLVGLQWWPSDRLAITVEGGIRTVPYAGLMVGLRL